MGDSSKEKIIHIFSKARGFAYLGMYSEGLSEFEDGIKKLQEMVGKSKLDGKLQSEWSTLYQELKEEVAQCRVMSKIIETGRIDFKSTAPSTEDERGRFRVTTRITHPEEQQTVRQGSFLPSQQAAAWRSCDAESLQRTGKGGSWSLPQT